MRDLKVRSEIIKAKKDLEKWSLDAACENFTDKELRYVIDRIIDGYIMKTQNVLFSALFRARSNEDQKRFQNVSEIWYPPKANIKSRGRFNLPYEQMLYLGRNIATCVKECRISIGEKATIALIRQKPGLSVELGEIGVSEKITEKDPRWTYFPSYRPKHPASLTVNLNEVHKARVEIIRKLLVAECLKPSTQEDQENTYKKSRAIGAVLMSFPLCDGLSYPSVDDPEYPTMGGENLVLFNNSADKKLYVESCAEVRLTHKAYVGLGFEWITGVCPVDSHGRILWEAPSSASYPTNF